MTYLTIHNAKKIHSYTHPRTHLTTFHMHTYKYTHIHRNVCVCMCPSMFLCVTHVTHVRNRTYKLKLKKD